MRVKTTYVGIKDGIRGIWCGSKPKGVEITEERKVLVPKAGYELEKNGERFSSVWLKDDDVKENYKEVEIDQGLGDEA